MLNFVESINFARNEDDSRFFFTFSNLPKNMGITLGNYLRRFLLDYTVGISLIGLRMINEEDSSVKINNQFSIYPGINTPTPFLIQNLKKIVIVRKNDNDVNYNEPFSFSMKFSNETDEETKIYSKHLELSEEFELKNPDLYLTTLSPKKCLNIITYWREDWGYHSSSKQKKDYFFQDMEDVIVLDTDYSPLSSSTVNFTVDNVITGPNDEAEEKMVLSISKDNKNYFDFDSFLLKAFSKSKDIFSHLLSKINIKED